MKKIGHFILALTAWFLAGSLNAQQNVEFTKANFPNLKAELKEALANIKEGDKIYNQGPYFYAQALPYFLKANNFNPNNAILNYKIGNCLLQSPQKAKAIEHLEKAQKLKPDIGSGIYFSLATAYQNNLQWDKAIDLYKTYKATIPSKYPDEIFITDKRISECENGKKFVDKPVRILIENVGNGINTIYPEYSPVISADESVIYFTSRRDNTTGGGISNIDEKYYEDVYRGIRDSKESWGNIANLSSVNTDFNDATVNLSPDGQKLLLYKDGKRGGDIYQSILVGSEWSKPEPLSNSVNTPYYETHASYSFDGRMLYFVSNKPDGSYGGKDIYYCYVDEKGNLGQPINIGPEINTRFDEEGVFAHPDGKTLYFASQGHTTMGGFDFFKSTFKDGKWGKPENLGYPINSADDDVFFVVTADSRRAYFSSFKQDGFGEKDIYRLTFLGDEKRFVLNTEDNLLSSLDITVNQKLIEQKLDIPTGELTILKGTVYDKITKKPLFGTIEIVDLEQNSIVSTFTSNSATGKYLVSLPSGRNYSVTAIADNYLFKSENFNIPKATGYQEVERDFPLDRIDVGRKIVLKNIFFDFDKYTLRDISGAELERLVRLMNQYPKLKIEISGHTDNVGSETYNKTLSENRAKVVVDYLINRGIDKSRLVFKGYGFSQPIASNDSDGGRQLNRRTEFKVLAK